MLNKLQFQNLAELQLQNLDQTLCSKSEQKLFITKPHLPNLHQTVASSSILATVTKSTSFELASSHARVASIKSIKQQSVSLLVSDKGSQLIGLRSDKNAEDCPMSNDELIGNFFSSSGIIPKSPTLSRSVRSGIFVTFLSAGLRTLAPLPPPRPYPEKLKQSSSNHSIKKWSDMTSLFFHCMFHCISGCF